MNLSPAALELLTALVQLAVAVATPVGAFLSARWAARQYRGRRRR